jgi:hypothetical protein
MDNGTTGDDNGSSGPLAHDKAKLLALPSPIDVLGPEEGSWRSWLSLASWIVAGHRYRRWMLRRRVDTRGWRKFGMRVLRSCLLIAKVSTIPRLCPDPVVALLLGAALADSVVDRWVASAVLGVVHVGVCVCCCRV